MKLPHCLGSTLVAALFTVGASCSSAPPSNEGSGGSGSGGHSATGGTIGSGGSIGSGGAAGSGGSAGTGGRVGSGGAPGTGGRVGSGGTPGSGGTSGSGGGAAGASGGCGAATVPAACSKSGSPCSIDVSGTARSYYVSLPANYASSKAYPLVFQFHPMGGTAEQALTMYNVKSGFPDAIYVTPQGLSSGGSTGWPNTNGQDVAFTKAMLSTVQASYCVDKARIFSLGFSYGGMMSFALGCEMGDVFRAIAPMSGALYSGCKNGTNPVAMWGSHGLSDNVVPIEDGRAGRDAILKRNNCGTQTTPTTPDPCVAYQDCDSGYPSVWCEFNGQHAIPSFAASAIATFFKQF